jgi:MFS family permease
MLALLVSLIDRQIIALVIEPMKQDLGFSDTQAGWLYSGFAIFYAIAGYPIAWLADRKNRKAIISIGIFVWSLFTMACGVLNSFWLLFLARVGVGAGEAALTPSAHSLLGDIIPKHRIPMAIAIYQGGAILGTGLAFMFGGLVVSFLRHAEPVYLPLVGAVHAWQLAFIYVGAPGLLVILLIMTIREPIRQTSAVNKDSKVDRSELLGFYADNRWTIIFHHLGFTMLILMGGAFVFWTPSFFERVHGVAAERAAIVYGLTFILAGGFGTIGSAKLAQRLMRDGRRDAMIVVAIAGAVGFVATVLLIQTAQSALSAFLLYIPALVFLNVPFGLSFGMLPLIAPPGIRARVVAIYVLIQSAGAALGPPIIGMLSDKVFMDRGGIVFSLTTVTSVFGILGILILWACRKPYMRSIKRSEAT